MEIWWFELGSTRARDFLDYFNAYQGYFTAVVLFYTLIAVSIYAWWAKHQAKETGNLAIEARNQTKTTRKLVKETRRQARAMEDLTDQQIENMRRATEQGDRRIEQGERQVETLENLVRVFETEYEPDVYVRILTTEGIIINASRVNGLLIRDDVLADIPIELVNQSRGISEFRITVTSWFFRSPEYEDLDRSVLEDLYKGKDDFILGRNERVMGHFFINLKKPLKTNKINNETEAGLLTELFKNEKFNIELFIRYTGKKPKAETYYHLFYFRPSEIKPVYLTPGYFLYPGSWVFGGTSKHPRHPKLIY